MAVFKDIGSVYKGKKWRVLCYYTDWRGQRVRHEKRGFETRHDALEYERIFLAKQTKDINMAFNAFVDIYLRDVEPQLKKSTVANKIQIIDKHIRPYFKELSLSEITSTHILQWQNELLTQRDDDGKGYSPTYLRTINNQLTAIFNHAVNYNDLPKNPCKAFKKIGKKSNKEMLFWTKEEYLKFSEAIQDKPISYYAFQVLYWTGIRCGELLALTKIDIDLEKRTLRINKTYQVVNGEEMVTDPKTAKSKRVITMPVVLREEISDYISMIYSKNPTDRLFPITKSYLYKKMKEGSQKAGIKRIRIHDLRHSHISMLINMGYSAVAVADRVGHESITITYRYAHLFPSIQKDFVL